MDEGIIKNNKLISSFMNNGNDIEGRISFLYTINEEFPYSGRICSEEEIENEIIEELCEFDPSEFLSEAYSYHNSWDWLVPVIEKILIISNEMDNIEKFSIITDQIPYINETYKAVINFIEWYNEKTNNN